MLDRYLAHSLPDPAQNSLWYCTVPFTNSQVYHVLAERISLTFPKTPFRQRHRDGAFSYFPETKDIDGINVSFYETSDYRVTKWLDVWRKLIRDNDGNYGAPALFKQEIVAQLFSRDKLTSPVLTLRYIGCAPSDQTPFEMTYEDEAGRVIVEAQFSVDDVTME